MTFKDLKLYWLNPIGAGGQMSGEGACVPRQ